MSTRPNDSNPYLKRSLYLYDLPPELLESLTPLTTNIKTQETTSHEDDHLQNTTTRRALNENGISTSTACALCKVHFSNVTDQRQHVRSDFHNYNLKLQIKGQPPLDESTFIKQIGELDESISGSDSEDGESEDDGVDGGVALSGLLKKQAKIGSAERDDAAVVRKPQGPGNAPMVWLSSPKLPSDVGLGVYRALFTNDEQQEVAGHLTDILRRKQVKPIYGKHSGGAQSKTAASNDPHFFLCMIGGGHFAASVIGLAPEIRKGQGGVEERHAVVKAHKTFHRYTTRRKQGGSQSANDNSKGNAHSVGSSIRRANEAALIQDVRGVLAEWKDMIDSAELIFVRATGSQNRRTLFGPYEGQVLSSRDARIRGFPFSTRRATQGELVRAFQELTRLRPVTLLEVKEDPSQDDIAKKPQVKPKPALAKPTPEEEAALLHTSQLQNLVRRSKAPAILLYLTKNDISPDFEFYPPHQGSNYHAPTILHLAASNNAAAVVTSLLLKAKANPTIVNSEGKTPYEIAGDAKTHDAFRIARHELGEAAFDWSKAKVGPPLSADEASAKANKEQEFVSAAEAARRKADLERIRQEEEDRKIGKIEKKAGVGNSLGALPEKTWTDQREEDMRGLTPEMRQRLERERRARAAEARMKAMQGR